MSEIKHARGPWTFGRKLTTKELRTYFTDDGGDFIEIDSPTHGALAIVVWRMEDDERSPIQEANAHAINAATDLLEACETSLRYIEAVCFNTPNPKKRKNYADCASILRAAIAKATGGQS